MSFEIELSNPFPSGFDRPYGGPGEGGHVSEHWYIASGMDLGAPGGTPVYAAFAGHITKVDRTDEGKNTPPVYGAQIFMRSHNDGMGGFYTHLRDVPEGIVPGAQISRGDFLGAVVASPAAPHLHLALVEISGGTYTGVNLYQWFIATANSAAVGVVRFFQDGSPPQIDGMGDVPQPRGLRLDSLRSVQAALRALGYDPGPVDGVDGPQTRDAVRAFQTASGLSSDGVAGAETKTALWEALAAAGITELPEG